MAAAAYSKVAKQYKKLPINLKEKQIEVLDAFVQEHDTACFLPTGFGKSLCFMAAGLVMDMVSL